MKIGIDLSVLSHKRTGIGNYAFNLARALLELESRHEWVLFVPDNTVILNEMRNLMRSSRLPLRGTSGQVGVFQDDSLVVLPEKRLPFWDAHVRNARIMREQKLDVLHGVANVLPLFYKNSSLPSLYKREGVAAVGTKCLITLHDLAIYEHPEWFAEGQWLATKIVVPQSIKKADRIITPSETTKQDLQELFGVAEEKISVIAEGVEERFFINSVILSPWGEESPLRSFGVPQDDRSKKCILFVGTREPRKNLQRLIEAYQGLPKELKSESELWVAGGEGWKDNLPRPRSFPRRGVRWLGYVSDEALPGLYQNAALFVYPSLYEGFGLPVLEAMAAGVPAICSKQIAGNFQFPISKSQINSNNQNTNELPLIAVDPYSVVEIQEAMRMLLDDGELRRKIGEQGRQIAKEFTWKRAARATLAVYEEIFRENPKSV